MCATNAGIHLSLTPRAGSVIGSVDSKCSGMPTCRRLRVLVMSVWFPASCIMSSLIPIHLVNVFEIGEPNKPCVVLHRSKVLNASSVHSHADTLA